RTLYSSNELPAGSKPSRSASPSTRRSGSSTGSAPASSARLVLKATVLKPIPIASVVTLTAVNAGCLASRRAPHRPSCDVVSSSRTRLASGHCSAICVMPPMPRSAARLAWSGVMTEATFSAICSSRWKRSSAASSRSTVSRRNRLLSRSRSVLHQRMRPSGFLQHEIDGRGQPLPLRHLPLQVRAARAGERIELRGARAGRVAPLGLDPALLLEPVQRGVQRALLHLQLVARHLLDPLRDGPPVLRLERQRAQNQDVQRPLNQIARLPHVYTSTIYNCRPSTHVGARPRLSGGPQS